MQWRGLAWRGCSAKEADKHTSTQIHQHTEALQTSSLSQGDLCSSEAGTRSSGIHTGAALTHINTCLFDHTHRTSLVYWIRMAFRECPDAGSFAAPLKGLEI